MSILHETFIRSAKVSCIIHLRMNAIWISLLILWFHPFGVLSSHGLTGNVSSRRPAVVNVGAIFSFDSTIGRVAKIAIQEGVKDVNSDSTVLPGTKLVIQMHNSNCSGFVGMVGGIFF